jgi:glutamate racemase
MKVGLVDWGIGGLSVYRELLKAKPGMECIYFSDSGATPYGKMSKKQLILRLQQISDFLKSKGVTDIVIACNAASTVLTEIQNKNRDMAYYGMLTSGAEMIKKSKSKNCLILGGKRTIRSLFFQNYFKNSNVKIQAKVAQPLSAFIEKGDMTSKFFELSLETILSNLKIKPNSVLLACTHYPAIQKQIQKRLPSCQILDPSLTVVHHLLKKSKRSYKKATTQFFTTGSASAMKASAQKAFQIKVTSVKKAF